MNIQNVVHLMNIMSMMSLAHVKVLFLILGCKLLLSEFGIECLHFH